MAKQFFKDKKILIIKLGYSETLDQEIGRIPSLGDILRTTPILWALKEKYPEHKEVINKLAKSRHDEIVNLS